MNTNNKNTWIVIFLMLWLLVVPSVVEARPDDMSAEEWAEERQSIFEEKHEDIVRVVDEVNDNIVQVVDDINEEIVSNIDGTVSKPEEEWECVGSHIGNTVFWVPDFCFQEALEQIQSTTSVSDLYCYRGYMGPDNEITITVTPQEDWPLCSEFQL